MLLDLRMSLLLLIFICHMPSNGKESFFVFFLFFNDDNLSWACAGKQYCA